MIVVRTARVLLEQMDPCVRTAVEFGEEAHWAGEIGLTLGWSSLTFRMFSRECANSLDRRRWYFLRQWFNLYLVKPVCCLLIPVCHTLQEPCLVF